MPIDQVIKMITGLQMDSESINNWTTGVARALKKYIGDNTAEPESTPENQGNA